MEEHNIVLLFAQETWIRKCDGAKIKEIQEYGFEFKSYRKARKLDWGGGVCAIYRKDLKFTLLKRNYDFKTFEHMSCKVFTAHGCIMLVNMYRPEYTAKNRYTVNSFLEELIILLQELSCNSVPFVILGDLNLHFELIQQDETFLPDHKRVKRKDAEKCCSILQEFGFYQLVDQPTHNLGGILDVVIVQNKSLINKLSIGLEDEVCHTDHFPININFDGKPLLENKKITIKRRHIRSVENSVLVEELGKTGIENKVNMSNDPNEITSSLMASVTTVLDKLCPIETKIVTHRPKQKWFTPELRELKRTRRRMERKYVKYPSTKNHTEFLEMQRIYISACKSTRSSSFTEIIRKNRDDLKKMYRTVNDLLGDGIVKTLPSHNDEGTLAEEMGNFFSSKIKNIRTEISTKQKPPVLNMSSIPRQDLINMDHFELLSNEDLNKIITSVKNKENLFDAIPGTLVKSNPSFFNPLLVKAINSSLDQGTFPNDLKHAIVSPIHKQTSNDPELNSSYRPVSNLPFFSKLHEKAALLQIQNHIDKNKLNPEFQSAYQSGHSCETAVCRVVNDMQKMVANGQMVVLAQLDMSAAFDTVDHKTLLDLLCLKFGITGKVLSWLESYLHGRSFSVKIQYVRGGRVLLVYGVPQGSILGPLLFILYISDIQKIAAEFGVHSHGYADDTQLYMPFDPFRDLTVTSNKLQSCVLKIEDWMNHNYLMLNVDKTEVMLVGKKQDHKIHQLQISFDDEKMYKSSMHDSVKFLGAYVDATLSMKTMISECVRKSNFSLKKLQTIKYMLGVQDKLLLLKTFILSKLDYCNILLCCKSKNQLQPLQIVLNQGIRFAYSLKRRESTSAFMKSAHILPVYFRVMFKSCVMVYRILDGNAPSYLQNIVEVQPPSYRYLRSTYDWLKLSNSGMINCLQSFMVKNWNSLPLNIRSLETLSLFKKHLKTHYFNIAFNDI